ncbi:hypothetical protein GCM10011506_30330 [Marivirga lumbricoides]|uniref:PKD domain-containing protein n=1 Tax=Marivirga lumbricoides TaxID=1046115 RepID=A0ABQ1MTG1_9BACT|nr:hypothetical protein GCM10011506_30330 [Marivirga lumbricoides]
MRYYITIFFLGLVFKLSAQVIADFNLPSETCLEEQFQFENTASDAHRYEWEFCFSDFNGISTTFEIGTLPGSGRLLAFDVKKVNDHWVGFAAGYNSNILYRFLYEDGLNAAPTLVEEVSINSGFLGRVLSIEMVYHNNSWYVLIYNRDDASVKSLKFGNNILSNNPSQYLLKSGLSGGLVKMQLIKDQDNFYIITNNTNGSINILKTNNNFESLISNTNTSTTNSIAGVTSSRDVKLIKQDDRWYSFISDFNTSTIYRGKFQPNIMNGYIETPTLIGSNLFSGRPNSLYLTPSREGIYLHTLTFEGILSKIKLTNIESGINTDDIVTYGLDNIYNEGYALKFFRDQGTWKGIVLKDNNNPDSKFFLIKNDYECSSSLVFSTATQPTISYSAPGTYPITLTAYDDEGNSSSITKEITVTNNTAPEIDIETGANLCITDPISFTGISNESISSWNWDFGDGNTATGQNTEFTFTSPGTYEIILEVEGANGCNNRIKKSITLYEPLPVTFSSSAQGAICSQKPTLFTNTTDSPPISTYEWSFGDGTTSTEENPEHVYQSAGDYTVRLSVAFAGCESFAEQTITVNPGPEVSFSTIDNCLGQSISFNNTSSGDFISSYLWDFGDGTTSTQENPEYTFETAGVKNISLTAFTTNGCDYTIQQNIEVFPVAVVDFEVEIACATQPIQFNEQVFLELSNVTDYLWDFGIAGRTDDISTFANPQFTFPEAGTYQVSLQVTTADGCVSNKQKTVMVNQVPEPLFNYTPKCVGNSITFNGNSNEEVASQYWELSNSKGEVVSVGANENFTYIFLNIGNYTLRYRQQNQQLCSNEYEETIRILPNPVPSFAVSQPCLGSSITFQNTTDLKGNTLESYNWLIDGELVSNDENVEFTFEEAGNYTIILEAITASGCVETTSQTITIEPIPSVNFTLEQLVGAYPFSVNTKVDSVAGFSYKWSINNQVVSTTSVLNEVLETAGTYFINLLVKNPEGCTVTSSQQVRVRAPELDFSLANLRIIPSDDFTEFVVSITNKGSIIPQEVDLIVDFGAYSITERVDRTINPESTINYALNTKLSQNQLKRLSRICLSASIKSNILSEEKKSDNRVCNNLESTFKIMDLYPNPSTTQLTIPLIIPEKGNILVNLEQADGKQNRQYSYNLEDGYNEITLERGNLKAGVYFVRISYQGKEEMKKVVFR